MLPSHTHTHTAHLATKSTNYLSNQCVFWVVVFVHAPGGRDGDLKPPKANNCSSQPVQPTLSPLDLDGVPWLHRVKWQLPQLIVKLYFWSLHLENHWSVFLVCVVSHISVSKSSESKHTMKECATFYRKHAIPKSESWSSIRGVCDDITL